MEKLENTILITRFIENYGEPNPVHDKGFIIMDDGQEFAFQEANYDSQWNWIMPVVEKIFSLGFDYTMSPREMTIKVRMGETIVHIVGKGEPQEMVVYRAVVEFINWYNRKHDIEVSGGKLYTLSENSINDITLNEKIVTEELHEYYIVSRIDFIDDLFSWISEARNHDKLLMKQDLEMLMGWKDDYIFSSNSTNSYIGKDSSEFKETCEELLKLNLEIKSRQQ